MSNLAELIGEVELLRPGLRRRIALSRAALYIERLWPGLWPALCAAGLFLSASLLGIWDSISPFLRIAAMLGVVVVVIWTAQRTFRTVGWPSFAEGRRRLETANGAPHRPLQALGDKPATPLGAREATLWRAHRRHMQQVAEEIGSRPPRAGLLAADPRAFRVAIVLALLVGLVVAGREAPERIAAGFSLDLGGSPRTVLIDAWITPPDYTGRAPIALLSVSDGAVAEAGEGSLIRVPEQSVVSVRLSGGRRSPHLMLGEGEHPFTSTADGVHEIEQTITGGAELAIHQGGIVRARWPLEVVADTPPSVEFVETPAPTPRQALRIDYGFDDDYGVEKVVLGIEKLGGGNAAPLEIELSGGPTRDGAGRLTAFQDLTPHPWAGLLVTARLTAFDAKGGTGVSGKLQFRLPERAFTHPVARQLIAIRRKLIEDPENRAGPARRLAAIAKAPQGFDHDLTVFSSLRAAYWRLKWEERGLAVDQVVKLLWDTALHLEDGRAAVAEAELRRAFEELQEALQSGAEGGALDEMMRRMQEMMANFMAAEAARYDEPPMALPQGRVQAIDGDILERMMEQIRELAAAGQQQAALNMLRQLQQIMENLTRSQAMTEEEYQRLMQANDAAGRLDELAADQRDLLERTSRRSFLNRLRAQNGERIVPLDGLAESQDSLRGMLDGIQSSLEEAGFGQSDKLDKAGSAMGQASDLLREGSGRDAMDAEAKVLDALEEARQALEEALQEAMGRGLASGGGTDPLGRPLPAGARYELPSGEDLQRAHEIMRLLQDRVSDPERSDVERDYLRRLLRRF